MLLDIYIVFRWSTLLFGLSENKVILVTRSWNHLLVVLLLLNGLSLVRILSSSHWSDYQVLDIVVNWKVYRGLLHIGFLLLLGVSIYADLTFLRWLVLNLLRHLSVVSLSMMMRILMHITLIVWRLSSLIRLALIHLLSSLLGMSTIFARFHTIWEPIVSLDLVTADERLIYSYQFVDQVIEALLVVILVRNIQILVLLLPSFQILCEHLFQILMKFGILIFREMLLVIFDKLLDLLL